MSKQNIVLKKAVFTELAEIFLLINVDNGKTAIDCNDRAYLRIMNWDAFSCCAWMKRVLTGYVGIPKYQSGSQQSIVIGGQEMLSDWQHLKAKLSMERQSLTEDKELG